MQTNTPFAVSFVPAGKTVETDGSLSILKIAQHAGIHINHTCNGAGTCGKCIVRVQGKTNEITSEEDRLLANTQLRAGNRLACRCIPQGDVVVEVPHTEKPRILTEGLKVAIKLDPYVRKEFVQTSAPSLNDQRSDLQRVRELIGLKPYDETPDLGLIKSLSKALRKENYNMTLVYADGKLIAVEPGDTRCCLYGVAFDIGTTTVVGYLIDLINGKQLAIASDLNPQVNYGADVISRIEYATRETNGALRLQRAIIGRLGALIDSMAQEAGIDKEAIFEVAIAGNTTMRHLALGLDTANIAQAPFVPVVQQGLILKTDDIGLHVHPQARLYCLPDIAAYVGADIVGDLLASGIERKSKPTLLLDIGTNGEMVLGCKDKIFAASSAAGPCFEGGNITHGMRASAGAIHGVQIKQGKVLLDVLGDVPARGICGTGLIDAIAEMLRVKLIDETGRLMPADDSDCADDMLVKRLKEGDQGWEFILTPASESGTGQDITITQKDIRQVQNAKAAFYAGIKIMCKEFNIKAEDITEVMLAGAFGNYINRKSAVGIGLIPNIPVQRIKSIGNAAGVGAVIALTSKSERKRAEKIAQRVEYIELSAYHDFNNEYTDAMFFE